MKHICYKHDHVERKKKEVGILIFVREIIHFWCTFLQVSQAHDVLLNQRGISYINKANSKNSYLFFM